MHHEIQLQVCMLHSREMKKKKKKAIKEEGGGVFKVR